MAKLVSGYQQHRCMEFRRRQAVCMKYSSLINIGRIMINQFVSGTKIVGFYYPTNFIDFLFKIILPSLSALLQQFDQDLDTPENNQCPQ